MDFSPKTDKGQRLSTLLATWATNSPQRAIIKLKRVLLMSSPKIINGDAFMAALYGQNVLDETPLNLRQRRTTALLRVQHGLELSCDSRRIKELVVALEWSENQVVIEELLTWAEEAGKQDVLEGIHSLDLAPQRVEQSFNALFSRGPVPSRNIRDREIHIKRSQIPTTLEVCGSKIIVGLSSGEIKIYNSSDLHCQTTLRYCQEQCVVRCVQCTCTEIIAGFDNGVICIWNIGSSLLSRTLSNDMTCVSDMRWRECYLVAGYDKGKVKIWQYSNVSFMSLGSWLSGFWSIYRVDFTVDYVLVLGSGHRGPVVTLMGRKRQVPGMHQILGSLEKPGKKELPTGSMHVDLFTFNGHHVRRIGEHPESWDMSLHGGQLITADTGNVLRIWDVNSGDCLTELRGGHESKIVSLDAQSNFIGSGNGTGGVAIWSIEAALTGNPAEFVQLPGEVIDLPRRDRHFVAPPKKIFKLCLGKNFVAKCDGRTPQVVVTEFS